MWKAFRTWWKEINQAGKVMDAYVDDSIATLEPGKNSRSTAEQRAAWTDAANWALTKVGD